MRLTLLILLSLGFFIKAYSQTDPELTSLIIMATNSYKKTASSQESAMTLVGEGHILTEKEQTLTVSWQKDFNEYLDSFRSTLSYAAEIYGFYYEVDRLIDNLKIFSSELNSYPDNAVALLLNPKKNSIIREVMLESIDLINDVRLVALSDTKMTEKERVEVALGIRPKLKKLNLKIKKMNFSIKYTSLGDLWRYIRGRADERSINKTKLGDEAFSRWLSAAKNVK